MTSILNIIINNYKTFELFQSTVGINQLRIKS